MSLSRSRTRSREPPRSPALTNDQNRPFLPPSHYAAAAGLSSPRVPSNAFSPVNTFPVPQANIPDSRDSDRTRNFSSKRMSMAPIAARKADNRKSQAKQLDFMESQLLPSLHDTIGRMTQPQPPSPSRFLPELNIQRPPSAPLARSSSENTAPTTPRDLPPLLTEQKPAFDAHHPAEIRPSSQSNREISPTPRETQPAYSAHRRVQTNPSSPLVAMPTPSTPSLLPHKTVRRVKSSLHSARFGDEGHENISHNSQESKAMKAKVSFSVFPPAKMLTSFYSKIAGTSTYGKEPPSPFRIQRRAATRT
jgi:hypothetical protein